MTSVGPKEREPEMLWQADEGDIGGVAFSPSQARPAGAPQTALQNFGPPPPGGDGGFFVNVDVTADAQRAAGAAAEPSYTYAPGESQSGGSSPAAASVTKRGKDSYESKFRIGLQSFKEKVGAERWRSVFGEQAGFQVTKLPEVEAAVVKIKAMEAYYQGLDKVLSAYSKALRSVGDAQGELARYWLEQGYKETWETLRTPQTELGNADQVVSKEVLQYHAVVDNVRGAVSTMLKSALADATETAKKQETARQEMDGFASKLQAVVEKGQEKALKLNKPLIELPKETKEIEQAKAQLDAAKEKYTRLTTQLLDKAGMLEAKRAADIPEQIAALRRSGLNCHTAGQLAYQRPAPGDG